MLHPHLHSHAAHFKPLGGVFPSKSAGVGLNAESPEVRELLEKLDDAIFAAIAGDEQALAAAHKLWPAAVERLGWELIEESREQYLRHAVDVTREFEWNATRDPAKAMAAVEIIELVTRP
jgi:hypothetical protein